MEVEIINEHQLKIINTSIFSDELLKKGINRLMNSPILDFICSMPESKWENFQKQFFDYYYNSFKEYSDEIGFESLRGKRAKIFNIYDDGTLDDNKELEEKLKNISGCKYDGNGNFTFEEKKEILTKKKENKWCFLGEERTLAKANEEYVKEIKEAEKDD